MTLEAQLEDLARTRWGQYRSMAWRVVHNREDAEDITQQAFMLAFQKLDSFKGNAQLSTWVGSIVKNCAFMKLRKASTRREVGFDYIEELDWKTLRYPEPDFVSQIDSKRQQHRVCEAINRLPKCFKRPLQLRIQGLRIVDIAHRLDMPVTTAKSYCWRGKELLGKRLA